MMLWHRNFQIPERKRYTFIGLSAGTIGTAALMGGAGLFGLFGGKKKSRDVPDPLAGLRKQLQDLAGQVPGQVAKQKELNAARTNQYKTEGQQGIAENIRAERGFGNTSLQDRLNMELYDKLARSQSEADLAAEKWGTGQQADILMGTAGMYPSQTELPEEPSWMANLLGVGTQMATQNWMQENQWKNMAKYFGGGGGGGSGVPILGGYAEELPYLLPKLSGGGSRYLKL